MKYEMQLISPDGEIVTIQENGNKINIPYYQIGIYLEKVVDDFIHFSSQNKDLFDLFKQGYHYFNPYFDFAITYLGYKMKNPLLTEESILYGENDELVNERIHSKIPNSYYYRLTDNNYKIEKASPYYLSNSVIDANGIKYDVDYLNHRHHDDLYEILLIENMIYNKELYEDYIHCMSGELHDFTYQNVARYFRGRLDFVQVGLVKIDSNDFYLVASKQGLKIPYSEGEFIDIVKDIYPSINIIEENYSSFLSKEEIERDSEIKRTVGEKYEGRRI